MLAFKMLFLQWILIQTVINKDDVCTQTKVVATVEASTETHKPNVQDMCTLTDDLEMTQPSTESVTWETAVSK